MSTGRTHRFRVSLRIRRRTESGTLHREVPAAAAELQVSTWLCVGLAIFQHLNSNCHRTDRNRGLKVSSGKPTPCRGSNADAEHCAITQSFSNERFHSPYSTPPTECCS